MPGKTQKQYGLYLANSRRLQGRTQAQVAKRIGVTPFYISLIETGRRRPSVRMLKRLVNALTLDPGEALEGYPEDEDQQ